MLLWLNPVREEAEAFFLGAAIFQKSCRLWCSWPRLQLPHAPTALTGSVIFFLFFFQQPLRQPADQGKRNLTCKIRRVSKGYRLLGFLAQTFANYLVVYVCFRSECVWPDARQTKSS